jgi:hypothetical protein
MYKNSSSFMQRNKERNGKVVFKSQGPDLDKPKKRRPGMNRQTARLLPGLDLIREHIEIQKAVCHRLSHDVSFLKEQQSELLERLGKCEEEISRLIFNIEKLKSDTDLLNR